MMWELIEQIMYQLFKHLEMWYHPLVWVSQHLVQMCTKYQKTILILQDLQEISGIPSVERLTSSKDRRVTSTNMNIGQHYLHEGIYHQGTSTANRRDYPDDSSDDNRSYRG